MFNIELRGKEGSEEEIKVVSAIPGKDGKGFRLHFPCLSVHVTAAGDDYQKEYYSISWSNYHERNCEDKEEKNGGPQRRENPGSFKVKRIEMKPEMLHDKDSASGRKLVYQTAAAPGGLPRYDYMEMAKRWNTHWDMATNSWDFGDKHPMERTEELLADCQTIDSIEAALTKRFGEFGITILELFVKHELFQKYVKTPTMVEQEELKKAA